jgi:hypothetical protein
MKRHPRIFSCSPVSVLAVLFLVLSPPLLSQAVAESGPQEKGSKTLLQLLEEENPLSELIYDLDECYESHESILEAEKRRLQAEKNEAFRLFWERFQEEMKTREENPEKKGEDTLADIGRMIQGIASEYNLDALFPGSPEERLRRCRESLLLARLQLKTARGLEGAYAEILKNKGYPELAGLDTPADWELWAKEIDAFDCSLAEERPPLLTEVVIPPRSKRPFVLKTFCLDKNRLGPGSGQQMAVTGDIGDLGRKNLALFLQEVAADPGREIDIQQAIWEEEGEEEKEKGLIPAAGGQASSPGAGGLSKGVSSGTLSVDVNTRDNFSSVELWIENPGEESRTVNVSGAVLDSGDSGVQRLVTAGASAEDPPPGPKLKDPERKIEEILKRAEDWLRRAQERIRNGDHSREALEDLIKAMHAAEAVGMDLEDADWDVLRDGIWEETELTYKVYKANPTPENRETLIENMKAMDYIDPPEGKQEAFDSMMEDIFG